MKGVLISCARCSRATVRYNRAAKYCLPCSEAAAQERKAAYAVRSADEVNRRAREKLKRTKDHRRWSIAQAGSERSCESTVFFNRPEPAFDWLVRFRVPFSYAASKNHIYGLGGHGHVHKRAESKSLESAITAEALSALAGRVIRQNKIWIGLMVEKSNHRGDAINVVDLVCDGVKKALPVDDRWFCLSYVDWAINKRAPHIYIQIAQEKCEDVQPCSACGQLLPFLNFTRSKHSKNGIRRVCRECAALSRRLAIARAA